MKNLKIEILLVHYMGSHWDEKTEVHWDHQMELQMDLNLVFMKELSWVLHLAPLKDRNEASLMNNLMWFHCDEKRKPY